MNLAMAMKDQPNDGTVIGMAVTTFVATAAANAGVAPSNFTAITTTAGFR